MTTTINYYKILEINDKATTQQIKQSYKKLALKHHPDKNEDKEKAKIMFTQISEAYTVLTNPEKRMLYDQYGTADLESMNFDFDFDSFFNASFSDFESFLQQSLFSNLNFGIDSMFSKMGKMNSKNQKRSKRAKGSMTGMNDLNKLLTEMMSFGGDMFDAPKAKDKKKKNKKQEQDDQWQTDSQDQQFGKKGSKEEDWEDDQDDQQDIPDQMQLMMLPVFIEQSSKTTKKNKKKVMVCNFDEQTFKTNQDLVEHFCDGHMSEFKKWLQTR